MFLRIDKPLAITIALLVVFGCLIFSSAVFGILGRGGGHAPGVAFNHLVLGVGLGLCGLMVAATLDYRIWKHWAPYLYGASLILTALVFIPAIGFSHGGGVRWIEIAGVTFQPSETIKLSIILFSAAYWSIMRSTIHKWYSLLGFVGLLILPAVLLIAQPDIGTLGIIVISAFAVYIAAGARVRDIAIVIVGGIVVLSLLAFMRPYMLDRVTTFLNPSLNPLAEGYQINQSLIAIGSGGLFGRGFGQGVQKFTYLPEPMGDSIYAVAAEEMGFIGGMALIVLFLFLALRGFAVAARAPDMFGALVAVGISTYLAGEAFINIAAMLGLAPLTGIPLTFISQGGSAMLISLASAGILLSISRRSTRT